MGINKANIGTDFAQRQNINAMFGDKMVGRRVPDILVQFQYGLSANDVSETVSGTGVITSGNAVAQLSTGASTGKATLDSKKILRYQPGFDGYCMFTAAFSAGEAGTSHRFGIFDDQNGAWVGRIAGQLTFGVRSAGVDIPYDININKHGLVDTNLNIYRITYGWLGIAPWVLEVYCGLVKGWAVVKTHEIAGQQAVPSTEQPSQRMRAEVERTSGSGAQTIKSCSWSAGRIGTTGLLPSDRTRFAEGKHLTASTEQNIVTITAVNTLNGVENKVVSELLMMAGASDGTKEARLHLLKNATIVGSDTFTAVNSGESSILYFPDSSAITGGDPLVPMDLGKSDSANIDVSGYGIQLLPGERLTLTGESDGASEMVGSLLFKELF